jgi:hypothetical protein
MPNAHEKHHYLPIFYLKHWHGPKQQLCEFSKPYDVVKPRRTNADGTGYIRGLYRIEGLPPETANVIETKFLKPADGLAANAMRRLVGGEAFPNPIQMRTSWARFVLSLMIRYPEAIDLMKQQLRDNVQSAYAETRKDTDPATFEEYEAVRGTDEMARLHGKLLMDLMQDSRMGRMIFSMNWGTISFSRYDHSLLTSDRPVISNVFPIGANHLCLPIGPEKLFFACETDAAEQKMQKMAPAEIMRVMNDETAKRAFKYVYGRDDTQLRFVQNRLGRNKAKAVTYF